MLDCLLQLAVMRFYPLAASLEKASGARCGMVANVP